LYEDDGETSDYQNGRFAETDIEVTEAGAVCKCSVAEPRGDFSPARTERTLLFNIHSQPRPQMVQCNSDQLDAIANLGALAKMRAGWLWDRARSVLTIKSRRQVELLTVEVF
jgi:hypothetical protein